MLDSARRLIYCGWIMASFEFYSVGRIGFGRGSAARLGQLAKALGSSALVVHNGSASVRQQAESSLREGGLKVTFIRQRGEPTVADVDGAVERARNEGCDCVIGLGGGSAIDAAKAVAGLLSNGGGALDYMEVVGKGQKFASPARPWIAVPTTAGTGAEATRNAVVGYPPRQFKASIRSELLLPRVALIDPQLQVQVPAAVTASSGMDALCQCMEAYTSSGANPMTGCLALRGVALAGEALPRAYRDGHDLDARESMALAALFSGIALTNAGLGAVHGFAAPMGALFPIAHGTICAALLPHVLEANVRALRERRDEPALRRYADLGRALNGERSMADEQAIDACLRRTMELARELRIPALSGFGLSDADAATVVPLARKASSMRYNPVVLSDEQLADVFGRAIRGV